MYLGIRLYIMHKADFLSFQLISSNQSSFFISLSIVSQSSSDRFIKVRFDNRAGIPVNIIPSKGDNKKQGYTIQPHMNLQLSYVEKGPFNTIPVTFMAQNPTNGEHLYINGRQGNLRVMPSASNNAVIEAIVSASCKWMLALGSSGITRKYYRIRIKCFVQIKIWINIKRKFDFRDQKFDHI